MPAVTPFEVQLLQAIEEHQGYPTEAIRAAVTRRRRELEMSNAAIGTVLDMLHDLGLVYRWQLRSGAVVWGITGTGRDVLAARRAGRPIPAAA